MNKKILSVSMIVKNEEENLEKCLTALKPLLDAVPGELIITDTGSTDKTTEIAKKFTDKIYRFDWVNDFSAARNFGLSKCSGEWFMFLDADDCFDSDLSEMIDFFNDAVKRGGYNSAYYITRNYSGINDAHSDLYVQRIARLTPELKFVGRIHEVLDNIRKPSYYFDTFADHTGYMFSGDEEREEKSKRNLALLFKELADDPDNIRRICQIADCLSPKKEADEYVVKAVELLKTTPAEPDNNYAYVKPYMTAINHFSDSAPEKTISYADAYIKKAENNEPHLIDAYAYKALAQFRLKRYADCVKTFAKCEKYREKFAKNELVKEPMIYSVVHYLDDARFKYLTGLAAVSHANGGEFEKAYEYFEKAYDFKNTESVKNLTPVLYREAVFALTDISGGNTDFDRLAEYYKAIVKTGDADKLGLMNAALEKLYYEAEDTEKFAENAFSRHEQGFFAVMGLVSGKGDLQKFIDSYSPQNGSVNGYCELFYLAAINGADLSEAVKKLNAEQTETIIDIISPRHDDFARVAMKYFTIENFSGSIKQLYFALYAMSKAVNDVRKLKNLEKSVLFNRFFDAAAIFVSNVYNPALLNDNDIGVLPALHRFGYFAAICKAAAQKGDKLGYVRGLKGAIMQCPENKDAVSFLLDEFLAQM